MEVTWHFKLLIIMTKTKALQILIDLKKKLYELPKAKGLPKGMGFAATRTKLIKKIRFITRYKTDDNLHKLLVNQAKKEFEDYLIEIYKKQEEG